MKRPIRTYIDTPWGDCCILRVTAFLPDEHWGGWLALERLTTHSHGETGFRNRMRRLWRVWRGEPDTGLLIETPEELDGVVAALQEMRERAFPPEQAPGVQ